MKNLFILILVITFSILIPEDLFPQEQTFSDRSKTCDVLWLQGLLGDCIGVQGMESVDTDGDGDIEIVVGIGEYWYILEYEPSIGNYKISWRSSDHYPSYAGIRNLSVFDVDNDGSLEILVAIYGGSIYIYDVATKQQEDFFRLGYGTSQNINRMIMADVDNDDSDELVIAGEFNTFIYNRTGSHFEHQVTYPQGTSDLACGDVNGDGLNEMILSNGCICHIDAENNLVTLWQFTSEMNYIRQVILFDVDGDGIEEIYFVASGIYVVDGDTHETKWSIQPDYYSFFEKLRIVDIDNNGTKEIVCGDRAENDILCLTAHSGEELWRFSNPDDGLDAFTIADFDGDGRIEGLWSAGCNSTGPDHVYVYDLQLHTEEWRSMDGQGPFTVIKVADCDNDQQPEIITLTAESEWYGVGMITVFDAATRATEWQSTTSMLIGENSKGMHDLEVMDIDNDGVTEIIVAGGSTYSPVIWVIDGQTHQLESSHIWTSGGYDEFSYFEIADVDNDGSPEYVMTSDRFIYVIDPLTYNFEWISNEGYDVILGDVIVENIDSDPNPEIIIARNNLIVIDGITHVRWETNITDFDIRCIFAYDYNSDGIKDIIAGTGNGKIALIDPVTREVEWLPFQVNGPLTGIHMADITGNATPELIYSSGGITYFATLDGNSVTSVDLGRGPDKSSPIEVCDYNQDGVAEVFAGGEDCAVEFSLDCLTCLSFKTDSLIVANDLSNTTACEGSVTLFLTGIAPYQYIFYGDTLDIQNNRISGLCTGSYLFNIVDARGCETSTTVNVQSVLETGSNPERINLKVFPVPAEDILIVEFQEEINGQVIAEISSLQGVLTRSILLSEKKVSIDISALDAGMYLIRIVTANGETIKKFIRK